MGHDQSTRRTFVKGVAATAAAAALGTSAAGTASAATSYTTENLRIESWDGTELAATLYLPEGDDRPSPSILTTHGWGGDRQGPTETRIQELYASNGYVVLAYDSRGFGESGGEVGIDGPKEVRDARALLDFLADHPAVANDGPGDPKVGMDGVSYAAGIQLNTAAQDDRLDAIVPRWAWSDLTYSLEPNQVVKSGWASLLFGVGITGARGLTSGDDQPNERDVRAGVTPRLPEVYAQTAATNDLSERHEAYYRVRSPAIKYDDIAEAGAPALFISAWNDTLFTPNEALQNYRSLRARGVETRLLLFQGGHTFGETPDAATQATIDATALAWVDEHVAGEGSSSLPPVTYYRTQTDEFAATDRLPTTADGETLDLNFVDAAGEGSTPVANAVAPTSVSQLAPAQSGDYGGPATAVQFDFPVEADAELLGIPELSLGVEPLGNEARLFVKLLHVTDDGETVVHNQTTPLKVTGTPGTVETVTLDAIATQRNVREGDTLRVVVATSDAGFFSSRTSGGARIHHAESSLSIPLAGAGGPGDGRKGGDGNDGGDDNGDGTDPTVSVTREDDGTLFTGGQTNQVRLTVDADRPVRIRDRTPSGWTVTGGDRHERTAPPETDGNFVEFVVPVEDATRTFFARAPSGAGESGQATFGPVEYSTDGGGTWTVVAGSTDENVLLAVDQP